ncbi:FAD/NAD(P)-binding domain-containing protein [Tothia fuscella]|uniref:FAD/NAD(P)-binding domain-containing protein n=1 Tax=Tothia fuscella TaxID=1048955 RepID=A0A9P4NEI0_9PEZI|nr:FAD/NAD(P)-binding domain-containing protein [Tothia fuscella]
MSALISSYDKSGYDKSRPIRIAIVGAGLSGLAVANGLLKDPNGRFEVQVYERDDIAFDSERGGYQLRISEGGLNALRTIADHDLWSSLSQVWAGDESRAPALADPKDFNPLLLQKRVHFNHLFTNFDYLSSGVAADGSNSRVNRQVGLNNKVKLDRWTLFQARGSIDNSVHDSLPSAVCEEGSILFLGGHKTTGFVSVYDPQPDLSNAGKQTYTLYWTLLIPSIHGKPMLQEGDNEAARVLPLLEDYLCNDLGYSDSLPRVMNAATEHFLTALLTSSVRPATNWRMAPDAAPSNARVILLGDAVHPMTPGRGMGANQALTDAGELVKLLHAARFEGDVPNDLELADLVRLFEKEMYDRTFKMVKSSETMTDLDLTRWNGRLILMAISALLMVLGWGVTLLEVVDLKQRQNVDFMVYQP